METAFYSIGEVSKLFDLPISTLRYYDKQNLIPHLQKKNGIRQFSLNDIEALRVVECLKASGLEIKEIEQFMFLCEQGDRSLQERLEIFKQRREKLQETLDHLNRQMDMIRFKCWYYETALQLENEAAVKAMIPEQLPVEISEIYANCHQS